ncbi:hypothetical protein TBR22_A26810 [Luteitalea sp. TBR-22]|uniref:retropepsin-like aspartic protease n=1 Tax=Luteitalea sp. TBR-22 TaxID=2802971 RepID=UPI001AF74BE9|nr:retropepsin-like aspartic protease [Luteitalea sp. TBR-22]BCS33454.1 hypothetical protein TBR22_A26810 [Luteitalea sp. TBR-22]
MTSIVLLLTMLVAPGVPEANRTPMVTVEYPLRIGSGGLPLVEVEVAAGRRAWFVLDTAATGTTLSTELAASLALPAGGTTRIGTLGGSATVATAHLTNFRLVGMPERHELEVAVHDLAAVRRAAPEAAGILGQDVLARYDYLLDLPRRRLRVGRFEPPPAGVVLPLGWSVGRPVVEVATAGDRVGLVLDSGADVLVMEATAARATIGEVPVASRGRADLDTHVGRRSVEVEHHASLHFDRLDLPAVPVVRLPREAWPMSPEVGLLPASLFSRVYVSARTATAVVWAR